MKLPPDEILVMLLVSAVDHVYAGFFTRFAEAVALHEDPGERSERNVVVTRRGNFVAARGGGQDVVLSPRLMRDQLFCPRIEVIDPLAVIGNADRGEFRDTGVRKNFLFSRPRDSNEGVVAEAKADFEAIGGVEDDRAEIW